MECVEPSEGFLAEAGHGSADFLQILSFHGAAFGVEFVGVADEAFE